MDIQIVMYNVYPSLQDTIPYAVKISVLRSWRRAKDCSKHVELILEFNKLLLLHLVGSSILLYLESMVFISLRTNSDYDPIQHEVFFIALAHCAFCGVRTESLNIIVVTFVCKGLMECDNRSGSSRKYDYFGLF
jgi:hypothetical protein